MLEEDRCEKVICVTNFNRIFIASGKNHNLQRLTSDLKFPLVLGGGKLTPHESGG